MIREWLFQIDRRRQERLRREQQERVQQHLRTLQRAREATDALAAMTNRIRQTQLNLERHYIDATVFGDVQRTYLVAPEWTWEFRDVDVPEADRIAAHKKASKLLARFLSKQELKDYRKGGSIQVQGRVNTYAISSNANVRCLAPNPGRFCVSVKDLSIPTADQVLAMKLYLENDEEGFLEEANFSDGQSALVKLGIDGTVHRDRYGYGGDRLHFRPYVPQRQTTVQWGDTWVNPILDGTANTTTTPTYIYGTGTRLPLRTADGEYRWEQRADGTYWFQYDET